MALFDGKGNSIEIAAKIPSILNGANVFNFGDSNVYYSFGNTYADLGSLFARLSGEFDIASWHNMGHPGKSTWQVWLDIDSWATDEIVEQYNKETTIILIGCATNDSLESWSTPYNGNAGTTIASNAVHFISQLIEQKFPKASYHWVIPPATDWSKWTGSAEADERNMAEKMPYIIQRLGEVQFPYCDMYHTSGITPAMLSDGVHLGGGGYDYTTDATYKYYRRLREYLINK